MRTREEILGYLGVEPDCEFANELVETAQRFEYKYQEGINEGNIGYGLQCDYECCPFYLEDCEMEKIEEENGIVVYKKLKEAQLWQNGFTLVKAELNCVG